ncbi:MAG: hypothetical protein NW226_06335 [Microscillaceae bacterium]|nr:hypothetical protein [Microscillaceae bacterium]
MVLGLFSLVDQINEKKLYKARFFEKNKFVEIMAAVESHAYESLLLFFILGARLFCLWVSF